MAPGFGGVVDFRFRDGFFDLCLLTGISKNSMDVQPIAGCIVKTLGM